MALTRPARIEVEIREVVLHGLSGVDRAAVGRALDAELTRILGAAAAGDWVSAFHHADAGTHTGHVDGGGIRIAPHTPPERTGSDLAHAIYAAVRQ